MAGKVWLGGVALAMVALVACSSASKGNVAKSDRTTTSVGQSVDAKPRGTTSTSSTSTTVPAPEAVPAVSCDFDSAAEGVPHDTAPPPVREVAHAIAGRVGSYTPQFPANSADLARNRTTVLAPLGWSCRGYLYGTGGTVLYVFPPSAVASFNSGPNSFGDAEQYSGPEVRIGSDNFFHGSGIDAACEVFPNDPTIRSYEVAQGLGSNCTLPAGRRITQRGNGAVMFSDGDGAKGAGVLRVPTPGPFDNGNYSAVTCRLTAADASLCDSILFDYLARNPASPPPLHGGDIDFAGAVGSLRFDTSTEADVRALYGNPGATFVGNAQAPGPNGYGFAPDYKELGYGCVVGKAPLVSDGTQVGNDACKTAFYINTKTGKLVGVATISKMFDVEGATVGTSGSDAVKLTHGEFAASGCLGSGIAEQTSEQSLPAQIWMYSGPRASDPVVSILAESTKNPVGIMFC